VVIFYFKIIENPMIIIGFQHRFLLVRVVFEKNRSWK
jgi:hypothetical protein